MIWITPEGIALIVVPSKTVPKYVREHTCTACHGWIGKKISTCTCAIEHEQEIAVKTPTVRENALVSNQYGMIEDRYDPNSFP